MNKTCNECIFHGEISERRQASCGRCDDPTEALINCVRAEFTGKCDNRMTREDVQGLNKKLEQARQEIALARLLLVAVQELIRDGEV